MANKVTLTATDGSTVEFYDEIKAQGGVKDVYFSVDNTYVVGLFFHGIKNHTNEHTQTTRLA